VATSSKAFTSDIAVKSRDVIKLHHERHNANSVISHSVVAACDYLFSSRYSCFLRNKRFMASIYYLKYFKIINVYCVEKLILI